jgi:transposase InsO family protein
MISPEGILLWYSNQNTSTDSRNLIDRIRTSEPSRRVGNGASNVSGRYPSKKMGRVVQFETHRVELAGIYEMENDPDVLEFYDQPEPIMLTYPSRTGRRMGVWHTAAFFVIRRNSAGWEEWKAQESLERLSEHNPNRYCLDSSGSWTCPPGQAFANQYNLYYRVRSSVEINPTYLRNVIYLEDYLRWDQTPISHSTRDVIFRLVRDLPGISVKELVALTALNATADDVLGLIAQGELYVDLHTDPVPEQSRTRVYSSRENALPRESSTKPQVSMMSFSVGSFVVWSGRSWQIANLGEDAVCLLSSERVLNEIPRLEFERLVTEGRICAAQDGGSRTTENSLTPLQTASPVALKKALERSNILREYGQTGIIPPGVSERTLFRWKAAERAAEGLFSTSIIGLLPAPNSNRVYKSKFAASVRDALDEHIRTDYESKKSKNKHSSWLSFCTACNTVGMQPPSYATFCKACDQRPMYEQTKKRKGHRAAYAWKPQYWTLTLNTPRHGDRPFEVAHIDHTELDVELIEEDSGINLGRPWLTTMVDAFSRSFLAKYLTFDPPSHRSLMMIQRDCVKRHGRLPQIIVVDGGPEFRSDYFELLLAAYQCTKKTRPPAESRFGSVVERLFGTCNTQFVHNLRGTTKIMKNVRQVTKSVNPKNLAVWAFRELEERLNEYLFEVYDNLEHPALTQSPRNCRISGMTTHGQRLQKVIHYNDDFIFMTMPSTKKGTAKLVPGRGIKINYLLYWSESFLDPELEGKSLSVRYDPFDAGMAYAFCHGQWVKCVSEKALIFQGRSAREIQIATDELRKRNQKSSAARFDINAKMLGAFLASVEGQEATLVQRARDRAVASAQQVVAHEPYTVLEAKPPSPSPIETLVIAREKRTDYGEF